MSAASVEEAQRLLRLRIGYEESSNAKVDETEGLSKDLPRGQVLRIIQLSEKQGRNLPIENHRVSISILELAGVHIKTRSMEVIAPPYRLAREKRSEGGEK